MENSIPFKSFRESRCLLANSGNDEILVGFFVSGGHGVEADEGTGRLERLMDMKSPMCPRSQKEGSYRRKAVRLQRDELITCDGSLKI